MKRLKLDVVTLFKKMATDCDLDNFTVSYCVNRLRAEGIKFWTVTLPKLSKLVLHSIEVGFLDREWSDRPNEKRMISCFAWQGRSLRYFRSLLDLIFCRKTGKLLSNPSPDALWRLRQLTEYTYKLALEFDSETLHSNEVKYEETQASLASEAVCPRWVDRLRKNAETFYKPLFVASPDSILARGPRFGPGSFAGSTSEVPFYIWKLLPDQAIGTCRSAHSPYSGYFKPYPGLRSRSYRVVSRPEQSVSELLFVPKDSRGPRSITKEPPLGLKAQMAFFAFATGALQLAPGFSGRINFLDQSVNQKLALQSSIDRSMATLDLKDASDRVRYDIVRTIFRNAPGITWLLKTSRSKDVRLPSGKTIKLASLAGMGSGFTFPILAFMVHLSICSRVQQCTGLPYKQVARRVYVYGDDVIVPREWYEWAADGLGRTLLKVNLTKSYKDSHFRESCGGDYFQGIDVGPVRLRMQNSKPAFDGGTLEFGIYSNSIVSLVKHTHELRKKGLNNLASYLECVLEQHIPMPYVGEGSPVLGRYTEDLRLIAMNDGVTRDSIHWIKCVTYSASIERSFAQELCPYKHLSRLLSQKPLEEVFPGVAVCDIGQPFGSVPVPRRIQLKYGARSVQAAMPVH